MAVSLGCKAKRHAPGEGKEAGNLAGGPDFVCVCVTHRANLNLPGEEPAETSEWKRVNQTEHPLGI